jgi:hypothetical protein
MGLEVGGYDSEPDWPKMGPSMLIATCLILAIRTAKWPAVSFRRSLQNTRRYSQAGERRGTSQTGRIAQNEQGRCNS